MYMTNGEFLRQQRKIRKLSMTEVAKRAGVTNSRLSHLENDQTKVPSPVLLKSLAQIYQLDIFEVFCRYGYIDDHQLDSLTLFKNAEFLTADEISSIQRQIDYCIFQRSEGGTN